MKKKNLPLIEILWQKFRDKPVNLQKLREALQNKNEYYKSIMLWEPPAQLIVPLRVFTEYNKDLPYNLGWMEFVVMAAYRSTKEVWYPDNHLIDALKDCSWPYNTPSSALLYLPRRAATIVIPGKGSYMVYYDLVDGEESSGQLELNIFKWNESGEVSQRLWIPLGEHSLLVALNMFIENLHTVLPEHKIQYTIDQIEGWKYELISEFKLLINILLYACGTSEDIIERVGHKFTEKRKYIKNKQKEDTHTSYDLRLPSISDIGVQFGAAIKRYINETSSSKGEETGITRRPHIRKAHPHLYWTGKDRSIPIVKYLPPIAVKGKSLEDEEDILTLRKIV